MKYTIICLIVFTSALNLVCISPQETDTENTTPRPMFFFPELGDDHPMNRTKRDLISSITSGGFSALLGAAKAGDGKEGGGAASSGATTAAPAEGEAAAEGGGGSSLSSLIPGFQEYGPAFMSLINNFLGFMKCCKPVIIPSVVAKLFMKCSDDLTNRFFQDSGFLNRSELDKKTTIFLKSPSLSGFFEAEFCAIKCVFGRMKLLGLDGLPIPAKMNSTLKLIMPVQYTLLNPAFQECVKTYQSELEIVKASKRGLTDSDRCWGSAAYVECMYRQIIQFCPEEIIEAGSQCLQKVGDFFWGEMPKQVGRFFSVIKSMVDIL